MLKILGLNFKAFEESGGEKGRALAAVAAQVALNQKNFQVIVFPQAQDLSFFCKTLSQTSSFKIFAQHADISSAGAFTGFVSIQAVKFSGASGVLLNHSEHKIEKNKLKDLIGACQKEGIVSFVCADSVKEALEIAKMNPDIIAVEPPELIGSGISVTTANPKIVSDAVSSINKINSKILVIVGAGISNATDVSTAIKLGAHGVLLASAFVKSKNPKEFVSNLVGESKG